MGKRSKAISKAGCGRTGRSATGGRRAEGSRGAIVNQPLPNEAKFSISEPEKIATF